MTGAELRKWRTEHMKMKAKAVAYAFGISDDTYWRMERREKLPRWVGLACNAIALQIPPEPMKGGDK